MAHCLVTGGAGFIGSHLVERLLREGHKVRVLDDLATGSPANLAAVQHEIEFVKGQVQNTRACQRAVRGIDWVFHHAALASVPASVRQPRATHDSASTGTLVLLDCCRRADVERVVIAGSSSCYGDRSAPPLTEQHPLQALSPYAAAKLSSEFYAEAFAPAYPLETVRLRYFNVFGPRQDPRGPYAAVIPLFVDALLSGRQPVIYGDGRQSRDFTHVDNVTAANLMAAQTPGLSGRVYNIAGGQPLSVLELLQRICQILNIPCDPRHAPPRTGDILHSWADISAATRDLGYHLETSLDAGLRQTVAWYAGQSQRSNPG
ncbi:MAG: SDR family oxidoreductase [Planctomycetaceae bacterium]